MSAKHPRQDFFSVCDNVDRMKKLDRDCAGEQNRDYYMKGTDNVFGFFLFWFIILVLDIIMRFDGYCALFNSLF